VSGQVKAEVFESPIGTYWFEESGILVSQSKNVRRTLENMRENISLLKRITGGKPACLIVHLTYSPKPDKPTLDYVASEMPKVYKAMAMVSKSGLAKLILFFLFKLKPPPIPMKTYSNEKDAKEWIRRYL